MAVPQETIWELQPHTAAKHRILRRYLDAWFPILAKDHRRIVYVDGFSGPGRYSRGEPGSPIIALESARTHRSNLAGELVFLFVEEREDRANNLATEIAKIELPTHFRVDVRCGTFATELGGLLDALDAGGHRLAPTFALIDPFGFSGIPYNLITRLLSKASCEVLVTFVVDSINRWLEHPDPNIRAHIVETFGTEAALAVAERAGDRLTRLKDLYQQQLRKVARFVRYFEMRDRNDRVVYYLLFASNNPLGHLKMKEAMWTVDPLGDFSFSDSTNPDQRILFTQPATAQLASAFNSKFHDAGKIRVGVVEAYVKEDTGYLPKHMREVLSNLESNGSLAVSESKADGKKRRANTFPNEALIRFL